MAEENTVHLATESDF